MELHINKTEAGVCEYPLHTHREYEIMLYTKGNGVMRTRWGSYEFSPNTVIIMPPEAEHGSLSAQPFENISIGGDFSHLISFESVVVMRDVSADAAVLAEMVYANRYAEGGYLNALCTAYIHCLLKSIKGESALTTAVQTVLEEISSRFCESDLDITAELNKSGFAEDYIRAHFRHITGMTPKGFLRKLRIERACFLIQVYGSSMPMSRVAESCGYLDYAYFSKRFKEQVGCSPMEYRERFKT